MEGRDNKGKFIRGHKSFWKEDTAKKVSEIHSGEKNPFFGKKHTLESKEKISLAGKGRFVSQETILKRKLSSKKVINPGQFKKGITFTSEQLKKILARRDKSSLEIKFEKIINHLGLPYKFVGNGDLIIARKCPDFVNTNGEKIVVDVYFRKHKAKFRNGLDEWKAERLKIFNKEGWELILMDETQVNEEQIKEKLGGIKLQD